ncbi:IclR family transcriptional regulator [Variovorax sp. GB1P17]|uniref:IclR family transcriptional regulator n=1 Tax=Variovorax sp. GB1P17 TaxID=3443740 RepID=UPI003F491C7E
MLLLPVSEDNKEMKNSEAPAGLLSSGRQGISKAAKATGPQSPQTALHGNTQDSDLISQTVSESSLSRMLGVLSLFSTDVPSLTVEQIALQLNVPKSTAYRYIQELCKVGLLVRLDRSITLGPRIIELDRCIRESDPVIRAAAPPMRALAEQTGLDVFISKLYGHSIITVHTEFNDPQQPLRYGRGRPVPIPRGASSKALVAFLPAARLRRLHQELAEESHHTPPWEAFYDEAQRIRKQGYCRTSGELNDSKTGISAPILGRGRIVVASVTALGNDARLALFNEEALAELVIRTAQSIGARLSADGHL